MIVNKQLQGQLSGRLLWQKEWLRLGFYVEPSSRNWIRYGSDPPSPLIETFSINDARYAVRGLSFRHG